MNNQFDVTGMYGIPAYNTQGCNQSTGTNCNTSNSSSQWTNTQASNIDNMMQNQLTPIQGNIQNPNQSQMGMSSPSMQGMQSSTRGGMQNTFQLPENNMSEAHRIQQQISTSSSNPLNMIERNAQSMAMTAENLEYLNGFLRTQVGKAVQIDFLIGSNNMVAKYGILIGVGSNYILIKENNTENVLAADFYHIKFVSFV